VNGKVAKPRNEYLVTWDKHTVTVHQYSIRGAIGCAYRNEMTDKFPTTPASVTSYEDFKNKSHVTEVTLRANAVIPLVNAPTNHPGYLEVFNVFNSSGWWICQLIGPYIRNGEPIDDNSHPIYKRHFELVESEFPYLDIAVITPTNPRRIIKKRGYLPTKVVEELATVGC
jgi:hypothetical protein